MIEEAKGLWIGFLTAEAESRPTHQQANYHRQKQESLHRVGSDQFMSYTSRLWARFFFKLHQNKKLIVWMSAACDLKYCYSI